VYVFNVNISRDYMPQFKAKPISFENVPKILVVSGIPTLFLLIASAIISLSFHKLSMMSKNLKW
jgi:hypothetical protein